MRRWGWLALAAVGVAVLATAWALGGFARVGWPGPFGEGGIIEEQAPVPPRYALFDDDTLAEKKPVFDPALVDSRPFEERGELWQVNASAAVIGLDVVESNEAASPELGRLFPSYRAVIDALRAAGHTILPSINAIDGKAKQFDDGLYAELDEALTRERMAPFGDTRALVRSIMMALPGESAGRAWLCGALEVGGFLSAPEKAACPSGTTRYVMEFMSDPGSAVPIGFYTWSEDLGATFRFLRYLQQRWTDRAGVPDEIAVALASDRALRDQYGRIIAFYARLTAPFRRISFAHLASPSAEGKSLEALTLAAGLTPEPGGAAVSFLPSSHTKSGELFRKLFGDTGLPPGADLMREFVVAIRSGRVDLAPAADSGWLDYQVYALETFLLPERGPEHDKLLLTKQYKQRLLEAFKVLVTKRYETHARQLGGAEIVSAPPPPPTRLPPRLRVEPNPTYYLRTARSYAFLQTFLETTVPSAALARLQGQREAGRRQKPLLEELEWMKSLFYGLHLVASEDIGMRPGLLPGELDDRNGPLKAALAWLDAWQTDEDLAVDTRVAIPIARDLPRQKVRYWATLGVRAARLKAWYAAPPRIRHLGRRGAREAQPPYDVSASDAESWKPVQSDDALFVVLVDEFGEFERQPGALTREDLRRICDAHRTKDGILRALRRE